MRVLTVLCAAIAVAFARIIDAHGGAIRNVDEYGEELAWMGAGEMNGFELHADHMPAASGYGHAETHVTFPGSFL